MSRCAFLLPLAFLAGMCGCTKPSYPREGLSAAAQDIIRRECCLESTAALVGKTFYLRVALPELVNSRSELQKEDLEKLQDVILAATRVTLSTDAEIEFLVLVAELEGWRKNFTIIQRLEDIKSMFYQRISKSDYEERIVYDFEDSGDGDDPVLLREMGLAEFTARLVVSKFNWLNVVNPFFNAALNLRLEIEEIREPGQVVLRFRQEELNPLARVIIEKTLREWAGKVMDKYPLAGRFEEFLVRNSRGEMIMNVQVSTPASSGTFLP